MFMTMMAVFVVFFFLFVLNIHLHILRLASLDTPL